MSEENEKTAKEVLGASKSATAKSIVLLAMSMDKLTTAILENKVDTDKRINALECSTNKRFDEIRVVVFLSKHSWFLIMFLVALIIIGIWSVASGDPTSVTKIIK